MWINDDEKVVVVGATGKTGKLLVEELQKREANFSVLARSREKARKLLGKGIEIVDGFDYDRPETARAGLEGANRLYLVSTSDPNWVEQTTALLDIAKQVGVKHIVRLSVYGLSNLNSAFGPTQIGKKHLQVENYIRSKGFAYTFVRPSWFHQNIFMHGREIAEQSIIRSSFGPDAKINSVDAKDIAEVAAIALTDPKHENRIYELTGPEALSMTEMAKIISDAIGKEINFVDMSYEESKLVFASLGLPPARVEAIAEIYRVGRLGQTAGLTDDVERVTGHKATSFAKFVDRSITEFGGKKEDSNEKLAAVGLQRK